VNSINGKFRTPKINYFYNLIDFLYTKGDNIIKLPLDTTLLNNVAVLAGVLTCCDHYGSFSIKGLTSENIIINLGFQFYLAQIAIDLSGDSLRHIMQKLAEFLKCKLQTIT
jgi:hypothetical protein